MRACGAGQARVTRPTLVYVAPQGVAAPSETSPPDTNTSTLQAVDKEKSAGTASSAHAELISDVRMT